MITLHMVYSEKCPACKSTKPVLRELLTHWIPTIDMAWENVDDKPVYKIFENSLGLSLDDPSVLPQEREKILAAGGEKLHALPTLYFTSSKRPMVVLDKQLGGLNPHYSMEEKKQFMKEMNALILKWVKKDRQLMGLWKQGADQEDEEEDEGDGH